MFGQFLAPKLHFLLSEGDESPVRELGPLFPELFYGLIPVAIILARSHTFSQFVALFVHRREHHLAHGERLNEGCSPSPRFLAKSSWRRDVRSYLNTWLSNFEQFDTGLIWLNWTLGDEGESPGG
jgi:hypothetical protein